MDRGKKIRRAIGRLRGKLSPSLREVVRMFETRREAEVLSISSYANIVGEMGDEEYNNKEIEKSRKTIEDYFKACGRQIETLNEEDFEVEIREVREEPEREGSNSVLSVQPTKSIYMEVYYQDQIIITTKVRMYYWRRTDGQE